MSAEGDLHQSVAEFLDWALMPPALYTTFPAGWGKLPKATAGRLKASGLKAGMPDILVFDIHDMIANRIYTKVIGLELKVDKGKPSAEQRAMFHRLREVGILVYICLSIEDVDSCLRDSGVPLRRLHLWHEEEQRERRRLQHDETSEKLGAGESDGTT